MSRPPVTFTLDVEDHRPDASWPLRFPAMTEQILDFLDERGVTGTMFVVGEVGRSHPGLVAKIAERGHEVALHGLRHVPLTELGPSVFESEVTLGKRILEDATGQRVQGFRAPTFSLVPDSSWAPQVLRDAGFDYSSSVLPASNPLFGWRGAPKHVFRWPSGLLEFPAPVSGLGRFSLPHLGGVYFRVIPRPVTRLLDRTSAADARWLYCHPYDFDPDEDFWVVPGSGRMGSWLLWRNRRRMFKKVGRLLAHRGGPPLRELCAGERRDPPEFHVAERKPEGIAADGGSEPTVSGGV